MIWALLLPLLFVLYSIAQHNLIDHMTAGYHLINGRMGPALTYPCFTVNCFPQESCIQNSLTKRQFLRKCFSKCSWGFLWPSDLITWVLVFGISFQLISCLSSWPHHTPDYRIKFSGPLHPVESKGWYGQWDQWLCLTEESFSIKGELTKIKLCDNYSQVCRAPVLHKSNKIKKKEI